MGLFIVLPAYNEELSIEPLFLRLKEFQEASHIPLQIILVDDGSADRTADFAVAQAQSLGLILKLVRHSQNQGLGKAMELGLRTFMEISEPGDCLATMDCDDTQPPELLHNMYHLITADGYDLVIASRYQRGSQVVGLSQLRVVLSYGASFLFRLFLPMKGVKDYTCGYRAYSYSFMQQLFERYGDRLVTETGFACMVDFLLKSRPLRPRVAEVAMVLRYDQKPTVTKMKVFKTIKQTIQLLVKRKLGIFT